MATENGAYTVSNILSTIPDNYWRKEVKQWWEMLIWQQLLSYILVAHFLLSFPFITLGESMNETSFYSFFRFLNFQLIYRLWDSQFWSGCPLPSEIPGKAYSTINHKDDF